MALHVLLLLLALVPLYEGRRLTDAENRNRLRICGTSPKLYENIKSSSSEEEVEDNGSPQFKIVNGRNSGPRPYAVQLIYTLNEREKDSCGGTMISSRHVLTAAHCVYNGYLQYCENQTDIMHPRTESHKWEVVLRSRCGHRNVDKSCEAREPKLFAKIKTIFVNRKFYDDRCRKGGDIAIFELDRDFYPEEGVVPACLGGISSKVHEYNSHNLTVFGWGKDPNLKSSIKFPSFLQEVNLKLQECSEKVPDFICTEEIDKNVCRGDSGGGMMIPADNTGYPTVIGTVSRGAVCEYMRLLLFSHRFSGGIFTDARVYNRFICNVTGVCPLGRMKKQQRTIYDELAVV
ncbi:hypothetical protein QR680_004570 [Steinernema hermaphroditum]|uniref:Peptidase S1 domain-containing protein n=1 Tax=Steinernema hermaphroditum TaxID=289476 RepID=A0AA39LTW5_9BILA|nr:hypothetical protein QR680_004570 [Steinernema hermaphroditum]